MTAHEIRMIAVQAKRDPKTVAKFLADPASVQPVAAESIRGAIDQLGLHHSSRPAST